MILSMTVSPAAKPLSPSVQQGLGQVHRDPQILGATQQLGRLPPHGLPVRGLGRDDRGTDLLLRLSLRRPLEDGERGIAIFQIRPAGFAPRDRAHQNIHDDGRH
jgi:hypothetical protein